MNGLLNLRGCWGGLIMPLDGFAKVIAEEVAGLIRSDLARLSEPTIRPALLTVKQAAVSLGRSEQSIQHLIFQRELPVVRVGRRVHLDRRDLDAWIQRNKF
jgi:excisionase family DNA binding protein